MSVAIASSNMLDHRGGGPLGWLSFALFAILVGGLVYPALAVVLGGALFPRQAQGSLVEREGILVGSLYAAQTFAAPQYLIGRPSAANNDPRVLAGSNLAASNPALREQALARSAQIARREGVAAAAIPTDLVTASGGGIDPHISPAAAELQVKRIAAARKISSEQVRALIAAHTQQREWGLFGQTRVSVLQVNLALDAQYPVP